MMTFDDILSVEEAEQVFLAATRNYTPDMTDALKGDSIDHPEDGEQLRFAKAAYRHLEKLRKREEDALEQFQ